MEASIPIWFKILVLIICALTVFILAAWELVVNWGKGGLKLVLSTIRSATKGTPKDEIELGKPSVAKPI